MIVFLAILIVFLAMLPLAQTDWAESMRSASALEGQAVSGAPQGSENLPSWVGFMAGFLKETVLMMIPGSITLLILRAIKRFYRSKKVQPIYE